MLSPYAVDASAPTSPDPNSPNFDEWQKLQRQKAIADALTAQMTQPQGAQPATGHMAAPASPLGGVAQMADAYSSGLMRQRFQQMLAQYQQQHQPSAMGYGTIDPTQAGEGLPY